MTDHDSAAPSTKDIAALFDAIATGDTKRITTVLDATPALASAANEQGVSPVMWSLYHRKPELAKLLQQTGQVRLSGFESCAMGDEAAVVAALDADADLLVARSPDGFTLLHLACFFDHADLAALLIERGADVNAVAANPSRVAPIHSAAACASTPIVIRLLEAGADANARQTGGVTSLHSAGMHGYIEMAEALLAHGADPTFAMEDGSTPISMAREAGFEDLATRLSTR
jgi:ankyrin repeat protein